MRSALTCFLIIGFLMGYTNVLYLGHIHAGAWEIKTWSHCVIGTFVLSTLLLSNSRNKSELLRDFLNIAWITLLAVYGVIIVNQFGLIASPKKLLYPFISFSIIIVLILLISAYRHGYLKDK